MEERMAIHNSPSPSPPSSSSSITVAAPVLWSIVHAQGLKLRLRKVDQVHEASRLVRSPPPLLPLLPLGRGVFSPPPPLLPLLPPPGREVFSVSTKLILLDDTWNGELKVKQNERNMDDIDESDDEEKSNKQREEERKNESEERIRRNLKRYGEEERIKKMLSPAINGVITEKGCGKRKRVSSVSTCLKLRDESWSWASIKNDDGEKPNKQRRRMEMEEEERRQSEEEDDPWEIKKRLTKSDVDRGQCRLLLSRNDLERKIIANWGTNKEELTKKVCKGGLKVKMWDCDVSREEVLVLRRWESTGAYVFVGDWMEKFVKRRALKEKDLIGIYWDSHASRFIFSILQRRS